MIGVRFGKILIILFIVFFVGTVVRADEFDDITRELDSLNSALTSSQKATQTNERQYQSLKKQLDGIRTRVNQLSDDIVKKENEVEEGEEALVYQKELLDERTVSHYKNIGSDAYTIIDVLMSQNFSEFLKNLHYQETLLNEDQKSIVTIVLYIKDIEEKKARLESEKEKLSVIRGEVDRQSTFLAGEIEKSKAYEGELQKKIATLTARQQEILAQKLAGLHIPRSAGTSAGRCSSDLTNGRDPGFSPKIGFFTYGAPHRKGMNQYGAWGRAKAGQNEEQILSEYYPGMTLKKDYDQGASVVVEGHGTFSIEDYVKRIYEVPDSWTDNNLAVLKAQAVAARTYALNTMQRRGSICTTEACQVFKPEPKGGNWEQAVEATRGWVLMDGGSPGFTQYASTHGGYILNLSKFDGSTGTPGNFSELNERAFDRESPWFYCNWGARSEYSNTAWMRPSEVADIINTILLARFSDVDKEHLYQPDKPNPAGKETWSPDRVRDELRARGKTPYDAITDITVSVDFSSGVTNTVNVPGDSISGSEFKDWFNLRAPANIQIVGPLFNVEKR